MEPTDQQFPVTWHAVAPSAAAVRLAALLAERLDAAVPRPFRVRAEGGRVALYRGAALDGGSDLAGVLDQELEPEVDGSEAWPLPERAASVAWNVLSSVQDGVAEATTEPWPVLPSGGMARPGTRTGGGHVYLWYGPDHEREAGAVLTFAPVALAELTGLR